MKPSARASKSVQLSFRPSRLMISARIACGAATETCIDYFGLNVDDPNAFAEWAMSISAVLFADPFGKPATRKLALAGASRVRSVIDAGMVRLSVNPPPRPPEGL